jgi:anti-sigma factor RsiW
MTFEASPHPGQDALEQYCLDHLSEAEYDRVEEHLLFCEECQEELVRVDAFIRDMKVACAAVSRNEKRAAAHKSFFNWFNAFPRPAVGAAFAAIVLVIGVPLVRDATPAGPPAAIQLATMRGPETVVMATAERHRPLQLHMSAAELPAAPSYQVQIVDRFGTQIWSGSPRSESSELIADVTTALAPGTYWVRLYASDNHPIREFGLVVK